MASTPYISIACFWIWDLRASFYHIVFGRLTHVVACNSRLFMPVGKECFCCVTVPQFICPTVGYLDCFYFVAICLWCATYRFCLYVLRSGTSGSRVYVQLLLILLDAFWSVGPLHSHQQCMRVPFVFHQHLRLSLFLSWIILVGAVRLHGGLNWHFPDDYWSWVHFNIFTIHSLC